jgi:hypothetical protein
LLKQATARQSLAQYRYTIGIHTVHLEHVLR